MDLNVQAFRIVQETTAERPSVQKNRRKQASENGRKGAKARSSALSPDRRKEIALKANQARWSSESRQKQ